MGLSDDIAGILDVLMALFKPSLWMIVVAESMRHPGIALHSHVVASCSEQLTVLVRLVSAEIEFRSDNMRSRHAFEGLCEDW